MNKTQNWITTGRTMLITKDREKGSDVTNFRPISCLPLMWNEFTVILIDKLYDHLQSEMFLPEEQKGTPKKIEGDEGPIFD